VRRTLILLMALILVAMASSTALAGAKLKISDEAMMDLGYRIQVLGLQTETDRNEDAGLESYRDWKIRRARFRLKTVVNEYVWGFLQTDVSGNHLVLKDAFIVFNAHPQWASFYVGQNMAPANRQNLTSSGALMAVDRPGLAYTSLTWGARTRYAFTMSGYQDSGLRNPQGVERDLGATIFGSGALSDMASLKYYVGIYNGIQAAGEDNDRFSARAQVNFWDPEPSYYNSSTYLGGKKTLGIGVSFDTQSSVAAVADTMVDYTYMSVDGFLEYPMGSGSLTVEGAWTNTDFDDVSAYAISQGSGFYGQAGYYVNKWQPWVMFETFTSDAPEVDGKDPGKFTTIRVGLTYYIAGQNANIKLGYENFKSDVTYDVGGEEVDTVNSFVLGFYTTY